MGSVKINLNRNNLIIHKNIYSTQSNLIDYNGYRQTIKERIDYLQKFNLNKSGELKKLKLLEDKLFLWKKEDMSLKEFKNLLKEIPNLEYTFLINNETKNLDFILLDDNSVNIKNINIAFIQK